MKKCGLCGKESKSLIGLGRHISISHGISSKEYYDRFIRIDGEGSCNFCGKPTKFVRWKYNEYCNSKCANSDPSVKLKSESTYKKRTGYTHNSKNPENTVKRESTCLSKYGSKHHSKSKLVRDKTESTCLSKYGSKSNLSTDDFKVKSKKTLIKKYGVDNAMKSESVNSRVRKTNKQNSNNIFYSRFLEPINYKVVDFLDNHNIRCECDKGHEFECQRQLIYKRLKVGETPCTVCTPLYYTNPTSDKETELLEFIKSIYSGVVLANNRSVLGDLELDVLIPELNIAFEFNGLYWHSDLYKSKNYHLEKTERCESLGIHLIHVFEDDWDFQIDIVKGRIKGLLRLNDRIFARNCIIDKIDNTTSKQFLEDNHIQGSINSEYNYGLKFNGVLVALMTFGNSRFESGVVELYRFCSIMGTNVIGGASKLFKHALNNLEYDTIVSYADRSWSVGNLYDTIGFDRVGNTPPNYYYVKDGLRMNRMNFTKRKLIDRGHDESKTEREIMVDLGYNRIYDSGNIKFIYK